MAFLRRMLQAGARQRWRSWLTLALLTAIVVGLVLAGAATSRRTATAFGRFEAAHGYDAFCYTADRVPKAASLPGVASVTEARVPATGAPVRACLPIDENGFSLDEVPPSQLTRMVKLVSGRLPDQSRPDEVVLGSKTMRQVGAHVGSTVRVALAGSSSGGGESRVRIYWVVGTTVLPADFNSQGLGTGAVFTLDGLLGRSCPVGTSAQGCLVTSVLAQDGVFIVPTAPGSQGPRRWPR